MLNLSKETPGQISAAPGEVTVFSDSTDNGRMKAYDGDNTLFYPMAPGYDKNLLINGGFDFAQRQVAATLTSYGTSANRQYTADRWAAMVQTSSLQFQRIDTSAAPETNLTARNYGKYKQITGAGKAVILQWVEGAASMPLRGRKVRLQVKLKRTVAAAMTVRVGLAQLAAAGALDGPPAAFVSAYGANGVDPTFGASVALIAPVALTAIGGAIANSALTCVLSGAWVMYSAVFTVPADCKNLAAVIWSDSQLAINDELNIGEAGLYDGPDVLDWMPGPIAAEIDRARRFYHKSFPLDVAPAQNAGLTGAIRGNAAQAGAVAFVHMAIRFPLWMRAAPTMVYFNPAAANAFLRYPITPSDATATSATQVTESQAEVTATGLAAWVAGGGVAIHYTADAEI